MEGRLYSNHVQGTAYTVANIASGASLSDALDIGTAKHLAIQMPAAWDAAVITMAASVDGTNFYSVTDSAGIEVSITAAASKVIGIDLAALSVAALRYIKLRSGTLASAVNQTAARTLYVALKA